MSAQGYSSPLVVDAHSSQLNKSPPVVKTAPSEKEENNATNSQRRSPCRSDLKRYYTIVSTLRRFSDSKLARMLDGSDPEFRVVNGQFFVDRDGSLFKYILDYLRTRQVSLPPDFFDYEGLTREAEFYEIRLLVDYLSKDSIRQRLEILEVRFSLQETHSFFRIFCSYSSTIEMLAARICVFAEQSSTNWNYAYQPQKPMAPVPLQRPSHHDLVFQCGTNYSAGEEFAAR
ncbi:UNVERIFIED_CONTAM: hypothetical protein FKN15_067230 [Acipenser sinensis]